MHFVSREKKNTRGKAWAHVQAACGEETFSVLHDLKFGSLLQYVAKKGE